MANGSSDYKLGELTEGFRALNARMDDACTRLANLETKIDDLNVWRFKVVGVVSVLAIIGNFGINLILKKF